jgi:DNA polymerase III epsilon subunit-like protein
MVHLNGNILACVDVETTGLRAGYHDIHQIAVLPLDTDIKPLKGVLPFALDIKIRHPDRIEKKAIQITRAEFVRRQQHAVDYFTAADLFDDWFVRLDLPIYKKLMPMAQNWPFDKGFLVDWLGNESFEQFFHPHFRDTMPVAAFHSDLMSFREQPYLFQKFALRYLCNALEVTNHKAHDALQDTIATAECYRRMLMTAF